MESISLVPKQEIVYTSKERKIYNQKTTPTE